MSTHSRPDRRRALVLFTRDLRVHDHPALAAALQSADEVIPLFVLDEAILASRYASPNRLAFLLESLIDLRESLRSAGGDLCVARGDPAAVAVEWARRHGVSAVYVSADVSGFARRRERRLADLAERHGIAVHTCPGVMIVPAGDLEPAGGDHYKVFTPYWRAWTNVSHRSPIGRPRRVPVPAALPTGRIPALGRLTRGAPSPDRPPGGEAAGRAALTRFVRDAVDRYDDVHDALAGDATSRLSPYLHFGCVSPAEVATRASARGKGGAAYLRQLCWRDFHHQVTASFPGIATHDYRPRERRWRDDRDAFEAWMSGATGVPIVDAGMRQLLAEGWMHNRARLIVAAFLTKQLGIDWRLGAAHFLDWLADGDIANNSGNWQWVAGTGNDTRPNRQFNILRQAARFDPDGVYVRRYVDELRSIDGAAVHRPWALPDVERAELDYPDPIVDVDRRPRSRRA